jgi:hypothetical protein
VVPGYCIRLPVLTLVHLPEMWSGFGASCAPATYKSILFDCEKSRFIGMGSISSTKPALRQSHHVSMASTTLRDASVTGSTDINLDPTCHGPNYTVSSWAAAVVRIRHCHWHAF